MTNQEAIEIIKTAIAQVEWEYPMNYAAAFDMAIKALEKTKHYRAEHLITREMQRAYAFDREEELLNQLIRKQLFQRLFEAAEQDELITINKVEERGGEIIRYSADMFIVASPKEE